MEDTFFLTSRYKKRSESHGFALKMGITGISFYKMTFVPNLVILQKLYPEVKNRQDDKMNNRDKIAGCV